MNPNSPVPNSPYLRPMDAGEIIAAAVRIYRDHFRLLVMVSLIPHLVLLAVGMTLLSLAGPTLTTFVAVRLIGEIANGLAMAAITLAIGRSVLGSEPGVVEVYRSLFLGNIAAVVLAYLVTAILVSFGLLLFFVPGILVGALFAPSIPLIVVERRRAVDGIVRAVHLMRGQLVKGMVVFSFFMMVAVLLPLLVLVLQGQGPIGPFTPLLNAIVGAVTQPLGFAANVVLYFSLRSAEPESAAELESVLQGHQPQADDTSGSR